MNRDVHYRVMVNKGGGNLAILATMLGALFSTMAIYNFVAYCIEQLFHVTLWI